MASVVAADAPPQLKPYACVLCQQRKVKCDRQSPCSGCRRYEINCIYRPPPAPKRRKRRSPEETLLARLRKYEELLVGLGVDVNNIDENKPDNHPAASETPAGSGSKAEPDSEQGELKNQFSRMIIGDGKTQLLENSLWVNLSSEIGDPDTILDTAGDSSGDPFQSTEDSPRSDGGEFIISGSTGGSGSLRALHPDTIQVFKLWQIYIDNMDPVTKLCHKPTVQQQILDATSDLDNISKPVEALMFGIYTCAVASLREDDCISRLGETREALLGRFHLGAKRALARADFLTSLDLTVYRAYLLYLLSLREFVDAQTLWVYSGVAMRIAQRLGLHRDGARFGLPIFEVEMRRRLWWPTVYFDGLCGELCGMGASLAAGSSWDTKLPLNVNDTEITPGMRDLPIEHKGITEMSFCLVRYEVGLLLRDLATRNTFDGAWGAVTDQSVTLSDRLKRIDSLEALLQSKYMQYCDTSISFHLLTWIVGYSCIIMLRFRARSFSADAQKSQEVRDALFTDTLQIIANYHTFRLDPGVQRYYWHVSAHFQWHAFIHLLIELQTRTEGKQVDSAWQELENVYTSKPELLSETKNPLYIAIGNLALKAWDARKAALAQFSGGINQEPIVTPFFIEPLRARRTASTSQSSAPSPQTAATGGQNTSQTYLPAGGQSQISATQPLFPPANMAVPTYGISNNHGMMSNIPSSGAATTYALPDYPVDWSQWETLLQGSAADINFEM
ncbi:fungal specific transcription factor domain-containing protein [Nannizzia gypsea CBS 118893]|uniref:C6 finger domain transcription factor nscR n=1 Tax=Arthroderma gypseum (strain ATCC MYA-4604 / CBS 118893) TaxID=535722 RepID=E4V5U4_ARTGP|nr:fungal specific transcription factor domain-containing protein [Nannizzia gypsea CBS 118893]EFR05469.1 fungal specific transcription factor domain-containing protein [Nannizzia gypsea CBS 118893]